jgi:plasmid stabilization system protein ParE
MQRQLIWSKTSLENFKKALLYIEENSPQNAVKVETDVMSRLEQVLKYPESCSPDKYRNHNPELLYRAFELHRFRISYYIGKEEIRIVRFRSTRMKPLGY